MNAGRRVLVALILVLPWLGGCAMPAGREAPYLMVLGTAQDAGYPQIGCKEAHCEAARKDPSKRRFAVSLLLADPATGRRFLFDCGPDIREQVELARGHPSSRVEEGPRPPLFDGIFLTHAHMGHYSGLIEMGREAYGARDLPVWGSERMRAFLSREAPWRLLVETGALVLRPISPESAIDLGSALRVEALRVPHRDEFSDTMAFRIRGPRRSVLYLPDIDKWETLSPSIESLIEGVDLALLDGTFFGADEVPGRSMAEIPHPFIEESMRRFAGLSAEQRRKVRFIHLNHGNPAMDPDGSAAGAVRAAGLGLAEQGELIDL